MCQEDNEEQDRGRLETQGDQDVDRSIAFITYKRTRAIAPSQMHVTHAAFAQTPSL
jgi:hypothetical protein